MEPWIETELCYSVTRPASVVDIVTGVLDAYPYYCDHSVVEEIICIEEGNVEAVGEGLGRAADDEIRVFGETINRFLEIPAVNDSRSQYTMQKKNSTSRECSFETGSGGISASFIYDCCYYLGTNGIIKISDYFHFATILRSEKSVDIDMNSNLQLFVSKLVPTQKEIENEKLQCLLRVQNQIEKEAVEHKKRMKEIQDYLDSE